MHDDFTVLPGDLEDGDCLFGTVTSWQYTADLDFRLIGDNHRYVEGFRRAAEVMSEKVMRDRGEVDALVMPILFAYRHWIELRLKDLWMLGSDWRNQEVDPRQTHDLRVLWGMVRPIIEEAYPGDDVKELDRVEAIVLELADADPGPAEAFRYAEGRGGPSLPGVRQIDLSHVRQIMRKLAWTLDGAAEGMREMLHWRREQESEWRAEEASYYGGE